MADQVRIGRCVLPLDHACEVIAAYTDAAANRASDHPYAYPAYDQYDQARNDPRVLTDSDLMAPGLLNVPVGIRSYYSLQTVRSVLEKRLAAEELASPLVELSDNQIDELVVPLFAVLDDDSTRPWGVSGTTLSKILHRKRPSSLPLHDTWVRACYLGSDAPVPHDPRRTWADYIGLLCRAMSVDLRQEAAFAAIRAASQAEPALTDLRLLDILAWHAGQKAHADAMVEEPLTSD